MKIVFRVFAAIGFLARRLVLVIASLQFAASILLILAAVLAIATIVEWQYGSEVSQFGFYRAWWFQLLVVLLGLSVLFSALVRFPWKRHHTGFLITHFGIIVLLIGALVSAWHGIDAQLPVFEGQTAGVALTPGV